MTRFRSLLTLLLVLVLFCAGLPAFAEDDNPLEVEDISIEDLLAIDPPTNDVAEAADVFTPSCGSPWTEDIGSSYWTTPMDITDTEAVWNMLMEPITVVDIGSRKGYNHSQLTKVQVNVYKEPDENSKVVGELTNLSQGVRVIKHLDNGWSLIECYSSSFASHPATQIKAWNILVSGYVQTDYLKEVQPTDQLALVVDKLSQRLYVFVEGEMVAELLCSTGLVQWNGSKYQPYNETRSGEFLIIHDTGQLKSDRMYCDYAMRFNAGDEIHEVPYVKNADGTHNYKSTEPDLGSKKSHGCIRVQRYPTPDGINMKWIANRIRSKKLVGKVKIVIWEDWQGRQLEVPSDDTVLYYNPNKGQYYHRYEQCTNGKGITFTPFTYGELEEGAFAKLKACPYCVPVSRVSLIEERNQLYAPGGDHEELLNSLRQDYYDYLAQE